MATEHTILLKCTWNTFSRTDHILGHRTSSNKLKKIEIIPISFSDHKGMKVEINSRRKLENLYCVEIKQNTLKH